MKAETLNIPSGETFQGRSGCWEAESCTPPGVLLRYFGGLCLMSCLILMIFVAYLVVCRLSFVMSAVACRPESPRLWSGFLA